MPGDPADVGHAGELVLRVHVKDVLDGERGAEEVPAGGVHDALGLARRARGLPGLRERSADAADRSAGRT